MDFKTRILNWEHDIEENPAILVLIIIAALAVVFLVAVYFDSILKYWKRKRHRRGPH
jgi:hypothetical protein